MSLTARHVFALFSVLLASRVALAAPPDEVAIRRVLDDQVAAWNRRDLECNKDHLAPRNDTTSITPASVREVPFPS